MASSSAAEPGPGLGLSDRTTRRSWLGLWFMVPLMHVVFVCAIFVLDPTLVRRIHEEPWYVGVYGVLVLLTLTQYFYTACSSPGYVIDVMRARSTMHATFVNTAALSEQPSSRDLSTNSPASHAQLQKLSTTTATSSWTQMVMDLYHPGSRSRDWTCTYCKVIQPPRTRHCHDCDKCVLQFDHHCIWLGTCIGKNNHCRFWWYIFEETVLCIWTIALYIESMRLDTDKEWWKDFVGVIMLAVLIFIFVFVLLLWLFHSYIALTNQTTHEVSRRRRIFYLRYDARRTASLEASRRNIRLFPVADVTHSKTRCTELGPRRLLWTHQQQTRGFPDGLMNDPSYRRKRRLWDADTLRRLVFVRLEPLDV